MYPVDHARTIKMLESQEPPYDAAWKVGRFMKLYRETLELIDFYYSEWNPEQALPDTWPRAEDGSPLTPHDLVQRALKAKF